MWGVRDACCTEGVLSLSLTKYPLTGGTVGDCREAPKNQKGVGVLPRGRLTAHAAGAQRGGNPCRSGSEPCPVRLCSPACLWVRLRLTDEVVQGMFVASLSIGGGRAWDFAGCHLVSLGPQNLGVGEVLGPGSCPGVVHLGRCPPVARSVVRSWSVR